MRNPVPSRLSATNRDNPLWLKLWHDNETDFHQSSVNPILTRYWPRLGLNPGSRIFVPLCGKSLDMHWLAQQGHTVTGVELSPLAVKAFFSERGLKPSKRRLGAFTEWRHGRIRILCGDFFALTAQHLGQVDQVYDRAALTALPADIRTLYIAHLREIVDRTTSVFLLTTEDSEPLEDPSSCSEVDQEVAALFSSYQIDQVHAERIISPQYHGNGKILSEQKLYRLTPLGTDAPPEL